MWVVSKVERRPGFIRSMSRLANGEDEIYVTARSFSVVCRFFLGEEGGGRPLSSIEVFLVQDLNDGFCPSIGQRINTTL